METNTPNPGRDSLAALTLAALGVVYGDIGTSPLYTVKEIFAPATGVPLDAPHLVGAVSVIVWALMLVVTLKYVILVLRADNRGEGGALALAALAAQAVAHRPRLRLALLGIGVFGATLFYGDSLITPAISVVGAMEGLLVVAPSLGPWIVPISAAVLVLLFAVQRFGTARVGATFGPIIVLWFGALAASGLWHIVQQPAILQALDPRQAGWFLSTRGWHLFAAIGAVVLAVTGAEALYADMGHFGRRPIQWAWTGLVLPALAINYMGQGALLLGDPAALENPFYRLFPEPLLLPALLLATLAAIIASQAVISGAYSVTRQAIALGWLPRMELRFTSAREAGQVYLPLVNGLLLAGVLAVVFGFRSASAMAAAYGIAVTLTMLITTVMTWFVIRHAWRLPLWIAAGATTFFLALDALLVAACMLKFPDGGWFPLALGALLFVVMSTWSRGRALLLAGLRRDGLALQAFVDGLDRAGLQRAERTAVYPVADADTVPQALLHNLKHNQVLHARNIVVSVQTQDRPWVPEAERVELQALAPDFWRAVVRCGFMEQPDLPRALAAAPGLGLVSFETSYFLSRETVVPTPGGGMVAWREHLYALLARNAGGAARFFGLPDNAVVELGTRVQI